MYYVVVVGDTIIILCRRQAARFNAGLKLFLFQSKHKTRVPFKVSCERKTSWLLFWGIFDLIFNCHIKLFYSDFEIRTSNKIKWAVILRVDLCSEYVAGRYVVKCATNHLSKNVNQFNQFWHARWAQRPPKVK